MVWTPRPSVGLSVEQLRELSGPSPEYSALKKVSDELVVRVDPKLAGHILQTAFGLLEE